MPLDLDAIAPQQREGFIRLGRHYGSELVLEQADDTKRAITTYAAQIARRGFGPRDAERLDECIQAQLEAGTQRGAAKADVRSATLGYGAALRLGKQARRDGDALLRSARTDLAETGGNEEAVKAIDITLAATSSVGSDSSALRAQLERQQATLALEPVAAVVADRGGPEVAADIAAALTALRAAEQVRPGKPGTPAETERLDLLDGMIIDLVRRARRAARAAAKALGQPVIANAFELDALYGRSHGAADPTPSTPAS